MKRTHLCLSWMRETFLLVILTIVSLGALAEDRAERLRDNLFNNPKYVTIAAHRGDWRNHPENSIPAFKSCPDMLIDGNYYEYEGFVKPWNIKKVSRMFSHGLKQSDRLIINNTKGCSDRYLRRQIADRLNIHMPIKEIWTYEKGNKRLIFKEGQFYKDNNREA